MARPKSGKKVQTINFDEEVLEALFLRSRKANTTISNLVNTICKDKVMDEIDFYRVMAKKHYLKFNEYHYMKEQAEEKKKLGVEL